MDFAENIVVFSSQTLRQITNNFDEKNLIGLTEFGRIFRGKIVAGVIHERTQDVSVKIWDDRLNFMTVKHGDEFLMIKEVKFLANQTMSDVHPNLVKLVGYCCEEDMMGVVYNIHPLGTLHDIIVKDALSWLQRVKVIYELAILLEFLHHHQQKSQVILNLTTSHILLDSDYQPKVFDILLLSKMKMLMHNRPKSSSCIDPYFSLKGGEWDRSTEIFSFGVIVLELMSKHLVTREDSDERVVENLVHIWAKNVYKPESSLVHRSLQEDWGYHSEDGIKITELAMKCVEFFPFNRPTMKEVLSCLQGLMIFRHWDDNDARPTKRDRRMNE